MQKIKDEFNTTGENEMKITLKKYPQLKLAHELLEKFPQAFIAGGVARDLINGKKFKDVDFFIGVDSDFDLAQISLEVGCFGTEKKIDLESKESAIYPHGFMRIKMENIDICVIKGSLTDINKLFDDFDMVSSQAWLEPTDDGFKTKATDLFHDLNNKKILGFYEEIDGGVGHIDRVKDKYPDYLPLSLKLPETAIDSDLPF